MWPKSETFWRPIFLSVDSHKVSVLPDSEVLLASNCEHWSFWASCNFWILCLINLSHKNPYQDYITYNKICPRRSMLFKNKKAEGTIFFLMKIERKILVGSIGHSPGFQEIIIYRCESKHKHIKGKRGSIRHYGWDSYCQRNRILMDDKKREKEHCKMRTIPCMRQNMTDPGREVDFERNKGP